MKEYIDREAVKRVVQNVFNDLYSGKLPEEIAALLECIMVDIRLIPTADIQFIEDKDGADDSSQCCYSGVKCYADDCGTHCFDDLSYGHRNKVLL